MHNITKYYYSILPLHITKYIPVIMLEELKLFTYLFGLFLVLLLSLPQCISLCLFLCFLQYFFFPFLNEIVEGFTNDLMNLKIFKGMMSYISSWKHLKKLLQVANQIFGLKKDLFGIIINQISFNQ